MKQTLSRYLWQLPIRSADLPAFHAAYFLVILIFAGIFDLGFFAVLILAHICVDFVKYNRVLARKKFNVLVAVFRESLTDVALFFLALSSFIYLHSTLPVIATLTGSRATNVIIMRGLALLLPKLTILHHSLRILFHMQTYLRTPFQRLKGPLSFVECVYLSTLFIAVCLLAVAPGMLNLSMSEYWSMLWEQLVPWKL